MPLQADYLYRVFTENIDDVIWVMDKSYQFEYVSPSIEKLIGYTQEEFLLIKLEEFILSPHLEDTLAEISKRKRDEADGVGDNKIKKWELEYRHKDGRKLWVETTTKPVRDKNGNFNGFIGTVRNIDERKAMELSLKESKYRLELALQSSSIGLWDLNIKDNHIFFDKRCAEILGYDSEMILSPATQTFDIIIPEERKKIIKHWNNQIKTIAFHSKNSLISDADSYINVECPVINKKNHNLWLMVLGKIVEKDSFANPTRAVGTCLDITEQKSFQKEFEKKHNELEYNVKKLEQTNSALNILIEHRDRERAKFCDSILNNFKKLVFPFINKMSKSKNSNEIEIYTKILEQNIHESLAMLKKETPLKYSNLTSTEVQVSDLIKEGISSKEIAQMLNVSERAVYFHRRNIRKKLNLGTSKKNLKNHLQSI
ncbi:MAG: PAS domain S-box protein [Desulfamplus sp.]|nr:PAS domain S-box protein [Desulfamplus sp.]